MDIVRDWRSVPAGLRGTSVALGNFDGVHLGHAHLVRAAHAARPDARLAVLSFEPHPRAFFRPDDPPFRLTSAAGRAEALAALGVRVLFELPFDTAFSKLSAATFLSEVVVAGIGAVHLASGPDFAFGWRKTGDVAWLAAHAEALGLGQTVVAKFADAVGPLSSTRIRRDLQDGYPERAAMQLGRPWAITGVVAQGQRLGRTIGFPTANVALGSLLEPARGVYAVTVRVGGATLRGVANIGRRPTVNEGPESRLEVHIFDFDGDLYGREIAVSLHRFLRAETRFSGIDALRAQIALDATAARQAVLL